MISNEQKKIILDNMIKELDIPDSAYETAIKRYEDLGRWFDREESKLSANNPHVFSQGSFRLGTAIRPLNKDGYDLDLSCKLRTGISKDTHSQEELKNIVGKELESYRNARRIKKPLETKHRCWCIEYQDEPSFHIDIVPCIPANDHTIQSFFESFEKMGMIKTAAFKRAETTIYITDDRHPEYKKVPSNNWNISNPEGYAEWFKDRMNMMDILHFSEDGHKEAKAKVDNVPMYRKKTPLQRVIQLLKRHRDLWSCEHPKAKPISIIITTLAAKAYKGETDIVFALENVLQSMEDFINIKSPYVPNPVDPQEDFADKWDRADCSHLNLKENFHLWLTQAKVDFKHVLATTDAEYICEQIEDQFSLNIDKVNLRQQLGNGVLSDNIITVPKKHIIQEQEPAKPWRRQ